MAKEIHYCSICGVSSEIKRVNKIKDYGNYLCEKHREQWKKYGKFLDNSSRGVFDPNEIRILKDYAEIDTYDSHGNLVTTFKLDIEDIPKLGTKKWRTVFKNSKPYLFTGNQKSERIYFHRLIFPTEKQIDHISGDTSDNRKKNLREVSLQENMMNLQKKSSNTSGIRGVSLDKKRNTWKCDFTFCKQRFYFKQYSTIEEAVYLRFLCEITFLKDKRNRANDVLYKEHINKLSDSQKLDIKNYFNNKINTMKVGVEKI